MIYRKGAAVYLRKRPGRFLGWTTTGLDSSACHQSQHRSRPGNAYLNARQPLTPTIAPQTHTSTQAHHCLTSHLTRTCGSHGSSAATAQFMLGGCDGAECKVKKDWVKNMTCEKVKKFHENSRRKADASGRMTCFSAKLFLQHEIYMPADRLDLWAAKGVFNRPFAILENHIHIVHEV